MSRGHLRIYLGAAPGVGKTFAMLDEGHRRRERGTDVVVGYVETHGRPRTSAHITDLEVVPRRLLVHRGQISEEMDLDAVLARRPRVALVDELAHVNTPGSRHRRRHDDIDELLEAGIDVISTLNIQHLESVTDVVEQITGLREHDTVADAVVRSADQVELVDMTPEALRRRLAHGNIYPAEKVDAALGNYFRVGNLTALRELALLWVADKVDEGLQQYMEAQGIAATWETRERVVVAVTGATSGDHLIRRAARMARRTKADLLGVHVQPSDPSEDPPSALLERHRRLLADLGGDYHEVVGSDVAGALTQFARAEHATQLVLGATRQSRWSELVRGSVISGILRAAGDIDVHIIGDEESAPTPRADPQRVGSRRRLPHLSPRRQLLGWILTVLAVPGLAAFLSAFDRRLDLSTDVLLYLAVVVVVSVVGGLRPAIVAAVASSLSVNWFFTEPRHVFDIANGQSLVALVTLVVVAGLVATLVAQVSGRSAEARSARAGAEALARVAGGLMGDEDAIVEMVSHLRSTFDRDGVILLVPGEGGWVVEAVAGVDPRLSPDRGSSVPLEGGARLVHSGPALSVDDQRVLQVFAAHMGVALERRHLKNAAVEARALAEADLLRTAILRAVSHDLRTPLSSIKACATSLLQTDVEWAPETRRDFLATIDEEADRLDKLVGNLLDMSRLETGAVSVVLRPVALEEVVAAALASLSEPAGMVVVEVSEGLSAVAADLVLLERVVANVVSNALRHAVALQPVRIHAGEAGGLVHLRVIDRGPGVAPADRDRVFEPFQRLGDRSRGSGVGLGLAIARGFTLAMGGQIALDDTPGGGLTVEVSLPPWEGSQGIDQNGRASLGVAPEPVVHDRERSSR